MKRAKLEKILFLMLVLLPGLVLIATATSAESDLLGWWPLDEGAGTVANDSSGHSNHGTIHNPGGGLGSGGSVWHTDPERGTVASFNGHDSSGAYVDAGMIIVPLTLDQDFTWGFWAKQLGDGTGVNDVIVGNRHGASDDLQFSKFTPTNFEFYNNGNNSGFINYLNLNDGVWLHHAVVKDGASLTYYRNGVVSGSSTTTATIVAQPLYMGGDANGERWSGWLSDVRIYDYAATEAEIAEIMNGYGSNKRPFVDAGDDWTVILPKDTLELDGTVTDDGVGDPNGFLAMEWSQLSGPGAVSFEPNEFVEDPTVRFSAVLGTYILQLYATDGDKDATDTVMIAVDEPFCPIGDFDWDCKVDWRDMQILADMWLDDSGAVADIDGDAVVDAMDFSSLAQNWLNTRALLVINEFMASNSSYLDDPQGQYDDWLEIYNAADVAMDVGGMYLTDDLNEPAKWRIPSDNPSATTIPAHGHLLIWADSDTGDAGLHANFKLDADGDEIGLFDVDGSTLVDSVSFSRQVSDISYGRYPDGSNNWRFFSDATAGLKNEGAYLGLVADTKFSTDRGFYYAPLDVVITCETPDANIHYTTDGSTPAETHGYEYAGPISVGTTTCLRAMAFKPGWMPSNVDAHTYIFLDDVKNQPANPPGFPSGEDYGMDPDIVNSAQYGPLMNDALLSLPTVSITTDMGNLFGSNGIYTNQGADWERPTSVELIYPDGREGFNVNCGIKIFGGASRSMSDKYSFRLLFKGAYGLTKLRYAWFGDDAADAFDTISLRGGFNDGYGWSAASDQVQYIRDEFHRRLQAATGHASPHGTFVHLYLNGLYWGLYNPCERPDASFSASYYGGDKDDWDSFSHGNFEIHDGDRTALNLLLDKCRAGLSSDEAYQEIQGNNPDGTRNPAYPHLIDIPNYIDYMIVNLWSGNEDWPWNNYWLTRKRTSDSTGFKFFCWDAEISMDNYRTSLTFDRTEDYRQVAEMQGSLKANAEYRMLFADHAHKHFFNSGVMTPASLIPRYQELADEVELAMIAESARWGDMHHNPPLTQQQWINQRNDVLNTFLTQRTDIALGYFKDAGLYPNVDAPVFYINGSYRHGGYISPTDSFSISAAAGTIYYTLDGNDPRLPGGELNTAHAIAYSGAVSLTASTHVKARAQSGSAWSALNEAIFAVGPVAESLRITEIMYHPQDTNDPEDPNEEYIELQNIGAEAINLNLVCFTNGIDFTFGDTDLDPGEYVVVVAKQSAFEAKYPTFPGVFGGEYAGRLNNAGERIELVDAIGRTIHDFTYSDGWRSITDGEGFSLTIIDTSEVPPVVSENGLVAHWKLDESSGSTAADSAGANDGAVYGNPTWTTGRVAGALNLDGSGDYILGSSAGPLTVGSVTVSAWVKVTGLTGVWNPVLTQHDAANDGCYFYIYEDEPAFTIRMGGVDAFASSPEAIGWNEWHHLAGTNDGSTIRLYVDGSAKASASSTGLTGTDYDLYIGYDYSSSAYFSGLIDDVRIYNRTLSDYEFGISSNSQDRWGEKDSWRASVYVDGSPGWDDSGIIPNPGAIVFNEILSHSHGVAADWIELYNTTDAQIDIGGWYLSDSGDDLLKYRIADGTKIDAYDYLVFHEDANFGESSGDPGKGTGFAFSENGEDAYLSSAETGVITGYRAREGFGAAQTGVSFGRYFKRSTGNYNFVPMDHNTPGAANAYPKVGPIVISEIMYNPQFGDQNREFVELHNISSSDVTLYDSNEGLPWKFIDGVDYTFPDYPGLTLGAGGYMVLAKDVTSYISEYGLPPFGVMLLGPYAGQLNDSGEILELAMPGDLDQAGIRHYIRIDRINYSDGSHPENCPGSVDLWPTGPDGQGSSLDRIDSTLYGNDPNNWRQRPPTPGAEDSGSK